MAHRLDGTPGAPETSDRIGAWLRAAQADAAERGLPELAEMLESLAQATRVLRRGVQQVGDGHDHR